MAVAKQQPFMPLFVGDFMAATADWEGEEASLYLTLLGYEWSLGSLPVEATKLCRLVRWDKKAFVRFWPQVAAKFTERDGRLYNDRLEQHRSRALEMAARNSESGKRGAEKRWRNGGARHSGANGDTIGENDGGANGDPKESANGETMARRYSNQNQNKNEEEEKNDTARGVGQGEPDSSKTLSARQGNGLIKEIPHSPPQDPRDFQAIKDNVAVVAVQFKTADPERIYKLGGQAYKLSKRQCEVAVKQLREDGFFNGMTLEGVATA